ncbi:unnamed protein product [Mycena citricolor]|uniref:Uncharacterized protein n=1 Tax=Mycena citricolor TaxID=2018698 RepID=A0AAD2JVH9_9AGAR|nr:unnamed protein product [Mycena citricolor]
MTTGESGAFSESIRVDLKRHRPIQQDETYDDYDYASDSDLDEDEERGDPGEQSSLVASSVDIEDQELEPMGTHQMGWAITEKGHAYKTWNAFFYYLYTKRIRFGALAGPGDEHTPVCSAKSMYKLADKFDLRELKHLAADSIKANLNESNIVKQSFCTFTSLFAEIQEMHAEILVRELKKPAVMEMMQCMHRDIAMGQRPLGYAMLSLVSQKLVAAAVFFADPQPV